MYGLKSFGGAMQSLGALIAIFGGAGGLWTTLTPRNGAIGIAIIAFSIVSGAVVYAMGGFAIAIQDIAVSNQEIVRLLKKSAGETDNATVTPTETPIIQKLSTPTPKQSSVPLHKRIEDREG